MPITIYTKSGAGLIPQAGRTLVTFPSGLIRVEQTFVCKASDADIYRAKLAEGQKFLLENLEVSSVEGFYIYPQPTESFRGDGFSEFHVTAYGRSNKKGSVKLDWKVWQENGTFKKYDGDEIQVSSLWRARTKHVEIVLPEADTSNGLPDTQISFVDETKGATLPQKIYGLASNTERVLYALGFSGYESTNYGFFREVRYSIEPFKLISDDVG